VAFHSHGAPDANRTVNRGLESHWGLQGCSRKVVPMRTFSLFFLVFAITTLMLAPVRANTKVGTATFSGIVNHVSQNNIKVTNPKTKQTLSFLILPKFDQVFSSDGKTTYQMKAIKPGQYVKIYYDQKMLGQRHADRILLLFQSNAVKSKQ
jgi:hypothetical protein